MSDHQRQDVVRQAREDGDDEKEDQDRRVDGEQAVVGLGVHELHAGLRELGADDHREQAADEQEEERGHDVLDADDLVVRVDLEVVLPRPGAVARVVVGDRRLARRPAEPVVEPADTDQRSKRRRDQRDDRDGLTVEDRVPAVGSTEPDGDRVREADRDQDGEAGSDEAWGSELGDHQRSISSLTWS
jgi:hypothetical protein